MDPKIWGPHAWIFLHSITFNYPINPTKDEINKHYNFFNSLEFVLPCETCRIHYKQNLKEYPLTKKILSTRDNLVKWLIKIHNNINKLNNKKSLTYEDVVDHYNNLYDDNKINYKYIIIAIVLFSLLCLVIIKK